MCDRDIEFYKGEKKEITGIIRSKNANEVVVITSADYEVTKLYDSSVVLHKGSCEIVGNEVTMLLEFLEEGSYELKVTAKVGREVIIEKASIRVR